MNIGSLRYRLRLSSLWLFGFMAFFLPFSTAFTLLFSLLAIITGLLGLKWKDVTRPFSSTLTVLCVCLFILLVISAFWSIAPSTELIEGVSKYRKLIYVPFVAALLLSVKVRPTFFVNFFVAGCLLVSVGSLLSSSGALFYILGPELPTGGWGLGGSAEKHWFFIGTPSMPTFGRAYIAQGAFLVIAAVFMLGKIFDLISSRKPRDSLKSLVFCIGLAIFFLASTFNLGGRTGYFLAVLGLAMWALFLWLGNRKKLASTLALVLCISIVTAFKFVPVMSERINAAINSIIKYHDSGVREDQAVRVTFWQSGIRRGLERFPMGWGVGSFPEVYYRDVNEPLELRIGRPHPHSEYILQFVQAGIMGLALMCTILCLVFFRLVRNAGGGLNTDGGRTSPQFYEISSISLALTLLLIDGFFNSIIWDLAEGHMFSILTATFVAICLRPTRGSTCTAAKFDVHRTLFHRAWSHCRVRKRGVGPT